MITPDMSTIHYFAYGSNLHPVRLKQRIESARLVGTTVISGYELSFTKRGQDSSGKGHINPVQNQGLVYGAVYQLATEHKADLDRIEGPGYGQTLLELEVNCKNYSCFAYIGLATHLDESLRPFHWYKSLIVLGAEFHGFPAHYIQSLEQTPSMEDPDLHRRQRHARLISNMKNYGQ